MFFKSSLSYEPTDHELEKASNSYLMSLVAVMAGLPIPIVNVLATVGFFFAVRKGTPFVKWHATQALLSQLSLAIFNSIGFWWTIGILFRGELPTNEYFTYLFTLVVVNLTEFIATIYSAVKTRKGIHVQWWVYGELTNRLVKT